MTREEVFEGVVAVLRRTFHRDDLVVTDATTARDVPGWDSLAQASVLVRLEKKFNVRVPDEAAYAAKNVGELVDGIVKALTA